MEHKNFLVAYASLNKGTEIPEAFAVWSGIAGVSCVLGRKCWLDMGTYVIYPNFYTILVAGSGRCRKSTAIGVIERILYALEPKPNLIAQRITPEALIEAMQTQIVDGSVVRAKCEGFVLVDELANFLNNKTYEGLASLLISLFDCKESFTYRTKSRGEESIKNSCLGLLGASTIDWIRNAIPEDAIGGGLTSRMNFVYVAEPPPPVAVTFFGEEKRKTLEWLIKALGRMSMIEGAFQLDESGLEFYKKEYERFYNTSTMYDNRFLSGYASRRHVHMLKLGIILSATQSNKRVITAEHLQGACYLLEANEKNLPMLLNLIASTEKGSTSEDVSRFISRKKRVSRGELMRQFSHRIDAAELSAVLDTLITSQRIQVSTDGHGKMVYEAIEI